MSKASLESEVVRAAKDWLMSPDGLYAWVRERRLVDALRALDEFEKGEAAAEKAEHDAYMERVKDAEGRACELALNDRAMQVLGEAGLWRIVRIRADTLYDEAGLPDFGSSCVCTEIRDAMVDVVRARIADAAF